MSWLSSLVSSAGSVLGNQYSSSKNNRRYKETEQYLAINKPSWQVEGLRDAGLNPMMAVMSGSLGSTSAVNTASSFSPHPVSSGRGGFNYRVREREELENKLLEAQSAKAMQETDTQSKLAQLYEAQSAKQIEDTRTVQLTNEDLAKTLDFLSKNPDWREVRDVQKYLPHVGPFIQALMRLTPTTKSSAKSFVPKSQSRQSQRDYQYYYGGD